MLYMDEWMRKYFYKEAIRGKQDKVKAFLFTSWQDYKINEKEHKIQIIASEYNETI